MLGLVLLNIPGMIRHYFTVIFGVHVKLLNKQVGDIKTGCYVHQVFFNESVPACDKGI